MSFVVTVFDPKKAPHTFQEFEQWYDGQLMLDMDPATSLQNIEDPVFKRFAEDLLKSFTLEEGSGSEKKYVIEDVFITDAIISMLFTWDHADEISIAIEKLVTKYELGQYRPLLDGLLWLPDGKGGLMFIEEPADQELNIFKEETQAFKIAYGYTITLLAIFTIGTIFFAYHLSIGSLTWPEDMYAILGILLLIVFFGIGVWDGISSRLYVHPDGTLEVKSPFIHRKLHLSEIAKKHEDKNYYRIGNNVCDRTCSFG